jgi:hypothetical protein
MYVTTHLLPPCSDEGGASIADDACRALRLETLFDPLADPQGRHDLREADTSTLARLRAALGPYTAAATIGAESAPLDDAAKRKLRALGYVW